MQSKELLIIAVGLFLLLFVSACSMPRITLFSDTHEPLKEYTLEGSGSQKILLISVQGTISDSPGKGVLRSSPSIVQQVVAQLKKAEQDKDIGAVLFKINSPGGTIVASDILYHEISSFQTKTGAKIIVSMMDVAASGAYYISLPADLIMAHPTTITGSVGVIFLRPKIRTLMDKIGLGVDVIKFGEKKDMGSPFRSSTKEEEKIMQKAVDDFGTRFLSLVRKHRKLPEPSMTEISAARVFTAEEALQLGMIDKIGYISDAVKEAKVLAGFSQDARVVVYRRTEFPDDNYYNVASTLSEENQRPFINLSLPDSFNLPTGFYYMWPLSIAAE